jgi:lipopolysaccharide transport system ATP-binding protein
MNTEQNHTSPEKHELGEVLVKVENVGKIFCRDLKRSLLYGVQDGVGDIIPGIGRKYDGDGNPILRNGEFWANQGINFELRRGECLGLIGHNGAGKTTLLKMLNGLIKPDTGRIEMRGKVGAIIALGAGFNPLLTGRENVYIAASVRGLSKREIDAKYEEIVDFAELHEFMDSPVQNYSSGMQVRLGFAVASIIEPDVLIIDEVLAVGDVGFRIKSSNKIKSILHNTAVIFVSHSMASVANICNKGLVLSQGSTLYHGDISQSIQKYNEANSQLTLNKKHTVYKDSSIKVFSYSIDRESDSDKKANLTINLSSDNKFENCYARIVFFNESEISVAEYNSKSEGVLFDIKESTNTINIELPPLRLNSGLYTLDLHIHSHNSAILVRSYRNQNINVHSRVIVHAYSVICR